MSPRMRIDLLVNDFTYRAVYDRCVVLFESNYMRNYIHVRDVVRVFQHALNNFETMKSNIFNLGLEDTNISKKELCDEIKKFINFEYTINEIKKDPDQRNYIVLNEKINSTGFKSIFSLSEGIKELKKGYNGLSISYFRNFS